MSGQLFDFARATTRSNCVKVWVIYAFISMLFAGVTSVLAKAGLAGISAELGMLIRTCFVFVFVLLVAFGTVPSGQLAALTPSHYFWLGASALTTTVSWLFYYKAIKDGDVSTVALIDKGSVVVAILLAFVFLKESITLNTVFGAALVVAGLVLIARK